jgi:hypothetical protein
LKAFSRSLSRILALIVAGCSLGAAIVTPVHSEVRFGKNVRVGGHDVSGQTFNKKRRAVYYIYKGKPLRPGCRTFRNRDGGTTKICHFQRKRR